MPHRQRGLTIIEIMVALAVAAVLIGVGLPAFNTFVDQQRMTTTANDFVLAIQYARSEASRIGGPVSVRAANAADDSNEWGPGWCVVRGTPVNCDDAIRVFDGLSADFTLDATADFDSDDLLTFTSRGALTPVQNGTFELCHTDAAVTRGRLIRLAATGRAAVAEKDDCA